MRMTATPWGRSGPATALFALVLASTPLASQGLHLGPEPIAPTQQPPTSHPAPLVNPSIRPRLRRHAPLQIKSLRVRAEIIDGIATTRLTQVFYNPSSRQTEGTWILPLPPGATADGFTMTMNGRQVSGEVLDARKARGIYQGIVRRRRDPGLLEYMGTGCLRARVFPIMPRAEMKVEVRYRHRLPQTGGVYHWWFPLRSAQSQGRPPASLTLDVVVRSQSGIKTIYAPLGDVATHRRSDTEARASLELKGHAIPKRDLDLYYGISDRSFGLSALCHRPKAGEPGFFTMLLAPKLSWAKGKALPKCINFVLDTSGSMKGRKILQARKALEFFVQSLRPQDSFNVVPFSSDAEPLFSAPQPANQANIDKALALARSLVAKGGTNIEKALCTTLKAPLPNTEGLVAMTVFLTDGMPTVDTTEPKSLLAMVQRANQHKQRVFVFGVGHDVNTHLLDKIAGQSRGDRDYVREGEHIEQKTSALFDKLSHPVMSEVRIDCAGIEAMDVYPKSTPDIFLGSQLMITGRYRGTGHKAVTVTGMVQGKRQKLVYEIEFPAQEQGHDFIPVLWARQRIGVLLDNIRLNGAHQELVAEVRRLGQQYGIVTPYTSHLILEENQKLARFTARHFRSTPGRGGADGFLGRSLRGPGSPGAGGPATPAGAAPRHSNSARIAKELARAGEAKVAEAEKLLENLGDKTRADAKRARDRLGRIGKDESGKAAVESSRRLFLMKKKAKVGGKNRGIAGLLVQRIKGRTFYLVAGVWTDRQLQASHLEKVHKVEAFSDAYFDLLKRKPQLAAYFAFSSRILVVLDGQAYEVE